MTIVSPAPQIDRDRYGRPLVIPPGGGKPIPYTRATTFVDAIEDKYGLQAWMQRMVALGLSQRPDLLLAVSAHSDDKRELDKICTAAREHAGASTAATTGTALHALTELVDRDQELPPLPDASKADLEAYRVATADLKAVYIERFCVQDKLQVGGTPDRIVEYQGERYIADLKTGSIEYGVVKIASQLAMYAHSNLYDIATGERGHHHASTTRGIIIHLPAGQARCELYWVDLEAGWNAVHVAKQVREQRKLKFADLTAPFGPLERPSLHLEKAEERTAAEEALRLRAQILSEIEHSPTADVVRAVWAKYAEVWSDEYTEAAKTRIGALAKGAA